MSDSTKVYIIAEAGVNHNQNRQMALDLITAAHEAGADAVKFQTFKARLMASPQAPKAGYQKETTKSDENQLTMLEKLELPLEWHQDLKEHADKLGIDFLTTAFDLSSLEFLETLNLNLYKIPSGEIVNAPLLWAFGHAKRKIILSTGMSTLGEVETALAILAHGALKEKHPENLAEVWRCWSDNKARDFIKNRVTLLHCTSRYPTPLNEVNLKAMKTLGRAFGLPFGYSDHTIGNLASLGAVSLGAAVVEKHFTLDQSLPGPDHKMSMEPDELKALVTEIRQLSELLGEKIKAPQDAEWASREVSRQNLIARQNIKKGQTFTADNITTSRAGRGLSALYYWEVIGKESPSEIQSGEPLEFNIV